MNTVAERMKMIRETFGLNRSHLAEILGVSTTIISMMEKGKANVSRKTVRLLEEKFGINPVWLTFGMGEMFSCQDVFLDSILDKIRKAAGAGTQLSMWDPAPVEKIDRKQELLRQRERREQLRKMKSDAPERLVRIRTAFDLNQNQLAKRLGFTRAYISAVEKGIQGPSRRMAELIEQELGVSANWLLYGVADITKCA